MMAKNEARMKRRIWDQMDAFGAYQEAGKTSLETRASTFSRHALS